MMRYTDPVSAKRREVTLGRYPELGLSDARELAGEWRRMLAQGKDPKEERDNQKKAIRNTVNSVWENYYAVRREQIQSHMKEKSLYEREIKPTLGALNAANVEPLRIQEVLNKVASGKSPRPTISNDVLRMLKTLFDHAIKIGFATYNPASPFKLADAGGVERSRDRFLSDVEIQQLYQAIKARGLSFSRPNYLAIVLLLVLGVRKMELLSAQWAAIDLEQGVWRLTPELTKTRHPVRIPLEPQVVLAFRELKVYSCGSNYVFPAHRKTKRFQHLSPDTLNAAIIATKHPLDRFVVHDLRRTCRTKLAELGVSQEIAERYINHKTDTYDRHDYFDQRRQAQRELIAAFWPVIAPGDEIVAT